MSARHVEALWMITSFTVIGWGGWQLFMYSRCEPLVVLLAIAAGVAAASFLPDMNTHRGLRRFGRITSTRFDQFWARLNLALEHQGELPAQLGEAMNAWRWHRGDTETGALAVVAVRQNPSEASG